MAKTVCDRDFAHSAMLQIQNQAAKTAFEDTGKKSFNFFLIFRIEVASNLFLMEVSFRCNMYLSR